MTSQPDHRRSWSLVWKTLSLSVVALALLAVVTQDAPAEATHNCAATGSPLGPFDLEAYEAANWKTAYGNAFDLAGHDELLPGKPSFSLPSLETGGRSAGSGSLTTPYIPPTLLKAIAWIESSWAMATYSVPYGEVGPPILSHSCAYGIMQIVSGMQNFTGVPSMDQAMIGSHYAFNIARGAQILADKWNAAPAYRPIVGNRDPAKVESWYYAVWSYHGWTYQNHPRNSAYPASRSPYRCDGTQPRSDYPYQELVFGCMKNPPVVGGQPLWNAVAVTLPSRSNSAFDLANWNECTQSYDCADMDIATPSPSHADPATPSVGAGAVLGSPSVSTSPGSLYVLAPPGGTSPTLNVSVANPGSGVLSWKATSSASWLQVLDRQGVSLASNLGSRNSTVRVKANASQLSEGAYSAKVTIESGWAGNTPKVVNVTLVVGPVCEPFVDMSESHWGCRSVQALYDANVTGGCATSPAQFCPNWKTSRADMAAFLLRAMGHAGHLPAYKGYFSDVSAGQWYTGYVEHLYEHGIASGYGDGTFRPTTSVSRAEAATLVIRSLDETPLSNPAGAMFADVSASHWGAGYIEQAAKWGIVGGYGDGTFRPEAPLARSEAATLIARAWSLPYVTRATGALMVLRSMGHDTHPGPYQGYFADVPNGSWYTPYVEHLRDHGVTTGYADGTYAPDAALKRAEAAVFTLRALGQAPLANPTGTVFTDVPADYWAAGYIEKLAQMGIVNGYANGSFRPGRAMARTEMIALTDRAWP